MIFHSLPTLICLGDKAGQVTARPDSPLSAKQREMVEGPLARSLTCEERVGHSRFCCGISVVVAQGSSAKSRLPG